MPKGEIPLLLQWDERWGYAPYGKSIVVSGCAIQPAWLWWQQTHRIGDAVKLAARMAQRMATG
ncbi:MAG: hypothetical protein ACLTST_08525 [Lachnospiraceae bacterium]